MSATGVGYTGGNTPDPTYSSVCGGGTGHAEAVQIEFDPERVSYEELVEALFKMHRPSPRGSRKDQYRSAVFVHSPEQEATVRAVVARWNEAGKFQADADSLIEPAGEFVLAEQYHQQYADGRW